MVYSLCLYQILLCADRGARSEFPIPRGLLTTYIHHVCDLLHCPLRRLLIGNGSVMMLVDLDANIALGDYIDKFKLWISSWIMTNGHPRCASQCYWTDRWYYRPVSPDDKDSVLAPSDMPADGEEFDAAAYAAAHGMVACDADTDTLPMVCHHIILITSRGRMLLPEKYRLLLGQITQAACSALGMRVIRCGGMRNHMHILGYLPSNASVAAAIDKIKRRLLEQMHDNIHFRRFDGWSDDAIAYVITRNRLEEEEGIVLKQDFIHRSSGYSNEMSYLYPRLGIKYVVSLR